MPRAKLDDAPARLLAAGLSLFASHGTERVNSNRIARRARLAVGTFYSHYSDKYVLLREIELRTLAGIHEARLASIGAAGSDPRQQVKHSTEAAIHFAAQHPEAYRVTFGRERAGASSHGPVVSESSRPTALALRRLQREGKIAADLDADLAARAYLSMEIGTAALVVGGSQSRRLGGSRRYADAIASDLGGRGLSEARAGQPALPVSSANRLRAVSRSRGRLRAARTNISTPTEADQGYDEHRIAKPVVAVGLREEIAQQSSGQGSQAKSESSSIRRTGSPKSSRAWPAARGNAQSPDRDRGRC